MASKFKIDISELKEFEQQIKQLSEGEIQSFCERTIKDLAGMTLAKIIERTPVGEYDKLVHFYTEDGKEVSFTPNTGKQGGTLRRGWRVGTVTKKGNSYEVEIINDVIYASYVEHGHRTVNHSGWVEGRFMMTISEQEIEAQGPIIIERRLTKLLEDKINGK